jgi:hypothetical protein
VAAYPLDSEYLEHQKQRVRQADAHPDIGAFENAHGVTLADAIYVLQILSGYNPASSGQTVGDVNGDERLGLAEVVDILNQLAQ